ncbi:MAG: hypothetical protein OIF32_03550, partial [Campylobacterales bacterium]|nr:hypothetical protein [Campylobacterales bacterium]
AEVTAKHIQEKIKKSEFEYIDHLEVIVGVTQYKENDSSVTLVKRVEDGRKRAKEDPLGVVVLP